MGSVLDYKIYQFTGNNITLATNTQELINNNPNYQYANYSYDNTSIFNNCIVFNITDVDTTECLVINNAITFDLTDIYKIDKYLDREYYIREYSLENKIVDLDNLYKLYFNMDKQTNLVFVPDKVNQQYGRVYCTSIIFQENKSALAMLSNHTDMILDKRLLGDWVNETKKYFIEDYLQNDILYIDEIPPQFNEYDYIQYLNFNNDLYRIIDFKANKFGQYKFNLCEILLNGNILCLDDLYNQNYYIKYRLIESSVDWISLHNGEHREQLKKNEHIQFKIIRKYEIAEDYVAQFSIESITDAVAINIEQVSLIFMDANNNRLIEYEYDSTIFLFDDIYDKIDIQIINSQTQEILIDNSNNTFHPHERQAINEYARLKFIFYNKQYVTERLLVYKHLNIREI